MNALYNVGPRLEAGVRWGQEKLAGGEFEEQAVSRISRKPRAVAVLPSRRIPF